MADTSTMELAVTSTAEGDPRTRRRAQKYQRWVAATTRPLDVLALIFLIAFLAGRLADNPPDWLALAITAISLLIWLAFAIDYVVRLDLSPHRGPFVRTHKLDLLMVLLPMLRMLRVVLLLRKSLASISMERIAGSLFTIVAVVVATGAVLEWKVEHNAPGATITTLGLAFWWAVVTTTTVGYGDTYPVTMAGRLIASVIMVVGIGLIGTVSATVAAWFVTRKQKTRDDELKSQRVARRRRLLARLHPAAARDGRSPEPGADPPASAAITDARDPVPDADPADDDPQDDDLADADLADAESGTHEELLETENSLVDAVVTLTAQIAALTVQQDALRASIAGLIDERSG